MSNSALPRGYQIEVSNSDHPLRISPEQTDITIGPIDWEQIVNEFWDKVQAEFFSPPIIVHNSFSANEIPFMKVPND
jgi:hypothetical protein